MLVAVVVVLIGYPAAMETFLRGRTLGKLVLGLRVVRDDGGPIRFRQALTRALVGASLEWPGLVAAADLAGQPVDDDRASARQAPRRPGGGHHRHPRTYARGVGLGAGPAHLAAWARTLDLVGLDDDLALAVRTSRA